MRVQLPNGAPGRISSKVEPAVDNREALVRFQHPAPFFLCSKGDWQRWQMHSPLKRDKAGSIPASPTRIAGLADMDMHSPFKRDEVGSIPTSRTKSQLTKRRHSITDQCSELLPRMMRVQVSLPLPMWGCAPTDEGARLRTGFTKYEIRVQFSASPPH